jgi:hypothetical protein
VGERASLSRNNPILDGSRNFHRPKQAKNLWGNCRMTRPEQGYQTLTFWEKVQQQNRVTNVFNKCCSTHLKCWVIRWKCSDLPQSVIKNSKQCLESMVQDIQLLRHSVGSSPSGTSCSQHRIKTGVYLLYQPRTVTLQSQVVYLLGWEG